MMLADPVVVTTTGYAFLVAWAVLGLVAGLAAGAFQIRDGKDPPAVGGVVALMVWGLFPLAVVIGALAALVWGMGWASARIEHRIPSSRRDLEKRIADLEHELEV